MYIIVLVVIVVFAAYAILLLSYFISWQFQPVFKPSSNKPDIFVSVIVSFKDEEESIAFLLNGLSRQTYNSNNFEIILVNDHSTDNSVNICKGFKKSINNLSILHLPDELFGKKKAIQYGVSKAKGLLIMTTDADCRVSKDWISLFVNYYFRRNNKLIIGTVLLLEKKGWIHKFFFLEQLSIAASTAGSALLGKPIMCSGANLAFEKAVYIEVAHQMIFETPSGDDMFLLMAVKKKWPGEIGYLKSTGSTVYTVPESGLKAFVKQRKRWISKSRYYTDTYIIGMALLVGIVNLILVLSAISMFYETKLIWTFLLFMTIKTIIDIPLVISFSIFFKYKNIILPFMVAQWVYPFYVVFISIYGKFGKFNWKDRYYYE